MTTTALGFTTPPSIWATTTPHHHRFASIKPTPSLPSFPQTQFLKLTSHSKQIQKSPKLLQTQTAPRDKPNSINQNPNTKEIRYKGMRKCPWGRYAIEIHNLGKKAWVWLWNFDTVEEAARAYNVVACEFRSTVDSSSPPPPPLNLWIQTDPAASTERERERERTIFKFSNKVRVGILE